MKIMNVVGGTNREQLIKAEGRAVWYMLAGQKAHCSTLNPLSRWSGQDDTEASDKVFKLTSAARG